MSFASSLVCTTNSLNRGAPARHQRRSAWCAPSTQWVDCPDDLRWDGGPRHRGAAGLAWHEYGGYQVLSSATAGYGLDDPR